MTLGSSKLVAVVEARMTSSRLPGKVLMEAGGRPLLQLLLERLGRVGRIDEIVVATTKRPTDDPIVALVEKLGVSCHRGSEEDVLGRVCDALRAYGAEVCVEVTGDCPLVDPAIVNEVLDAYAEGGCVYASNSDPRRSVPAGLDVQVFSVPSLELLERESPDATEREHVTLGFYRPQGRERWSPRFVTHSSTAGATGVWLSLDYREDYELIRALHEDLAPRNPWYGAREMIEWIRAHPDQHQRCLRKRPGWSEP